jgi:hypothetical protein
MSSCQGRRFSIGRVCRCVLRVGILAPQQRKLVVSGPVCPTGMLAIGSSMPLPIYLLTSTMCVYFCCYCSLPTE